MSAACENYKADTGVYRSSKRASGRDLDGLDPSTTNLDDYKMPFTLHVRPNFSEISTSSGTPDTGVRSYMTFKPTLLLRDDMSNPPSSTNQVTAIRDPFGNSYGYSTARAANPSGNAGYNPTFDLWTGSLMGADRNGSDHSGLKTGRTRPGSDTDALQIADDGNYPSVVRTTTSTRRLGLCSSIEPFGRSAEFRRAETMRLDLRRVDSHRFHQIALYAVGTALAQIQIVFKRAE